MRIKKRLWATLACFALLITLLPTAAFAAGSCAIQLNTDGIGAGDYIYFGKYSTYDISWLVLSRAALLETSTAAANTLSLLSKYGLGSAAFQSGGSGYYQGSTLQSAMTAVYDGFDPREQGAVAVTALDGSSMHASQSDLSGQKLFPLSQNELSDSSKHLIKPITNQTGSRVFDWWLRSSQDVQYAYEWYTVGILRGSVTNSRYVRPAFHLDLSKVLFTSAANNSGQNMSFAVPAAYSGTEWKLTLKDGNSFATGTSLTSGNTTLPVDYSAETLTFTHATLNSFTDAGYTDVTATLTNASGELLYYGSAENTGTDATSSTITIPTGLAVGNYTLSLYGEDRNAANATDYATGTPFTHTITVSTPTVSGVTVEPNTQSVAKGGSQVFTATVIGSNSPAQTVTWSVTGNASASTTISGGTLTVGSDETATTLTVKATSTVDNTQSGSATVTVTSTTPPGTDPIQYQFMKGQNGEWTKGSNKDLSFTANGEYSKFTGVRVDGSAISNDNYTSESGSTIVKLKALYLETLSLGRHTLRVDFTDGYAETSFTIDGYISIPKTGDNSRPMLWLGIALVAGAGLAAIIVIRRKLQNG